MRLFLSLLLALTAPLLGSEEYEKAKAKVMKSAADGLCGVAKWCDKEEYHLERDRLYEEALLIVPDHRKAREALKYVKDDDGEWVQSDEFVPSRNRGRVDFEKVQEKEEKVWERWARGLYSAITKNEEDLGEARAEEELRSILVRFPDHPLARKRLGYVEGWEGRKWVSPVAKRAYERRKELISLAKEARKDADKAKVTKEDVAETEFERESGIGWAARGGDGGVHMVTTGGVGDIEEGLEVVRGGRAYLQEVLGLNARVPAAYRIYLVDSQEIQDQIVRDYPGSNGREGMGSSWLGGGGLVVWGNNRDSRMDGLSRQTIGYLLGGEYGISTKHGWAWEGFGLYLSYRMTGMRARFFIRETEYSDGSENMRSRLSTSSNWIALAHEVMTSEKPPTLPFVLGKDVNQLNAQDLLVSYGLAAYLLEGHPDLAPKVLRRIATEPAASVLETELKTSLTDLQRDLTEWLGEMK